MEEAFLATLFELQTTVKILIGQVFQSACFLAQYEQISPKTGGNQSENIN